MNKPKECCDFGEYTCQIPMPIRGRRQDIDICIADIVTALNAANIVTVASCCGHGKQDGNVMLEDGRELSVKILNKERVDTIDTSLYQCKHCGIRVRDILFDMINPITKKSPACKICGRDSWQKVDGVEQPKGHIEVAPGYRCRSCGMKPSVIYFNMIDPETNDTQVCEHCDCVSWVYV